MINENVYPDLRVLVPQSSLIGRCLHRQLWSDV
jgi:hypothetical protein